MNGMWAVAGLMCFALALLAHLVMCRLTLPLNVVFKFLVVATPLGGVLAAVLLSVDGLSIETVASLLLYALACELYVFVFTFVSSSVSASTLMRLRSGGLTDQEIERLYSAEYMVESRFTKLLGSGLLQSENGGYALTARGERLLRVFEELRSFFRHSTEVTDARPPSESALQDPAATTSHPGHSGRFRLG
jgi:hypothetical protein